MKTHLISMSQSSGEVSIIKLDTRETVKKFSGKDALAKAYIWADAQKLNYM